MAYKIGDIKCATKEEAQKIKSLMANAYAELGKSSLKGDDYALIIYYANREVSWANAPIVETK